MLHQLSYISLHDAHGVLEDDQILVHHQVHHQLVIQLVGNNANSSNFIPHLFEFINVIAKFIAHV